MSDVAGLYRRFGVRLPDLGDGWVSVRCFAGVHQDRHPSARVHLQAGTFRCFTCGARGGVLDALQVLGVHDRTEARRLAEDYGVLEPRRRRVPPRTALPVSPPQLERGKPEERELGDRVDWDNLHTAKVVHDRTWQYVDEHGAPVGRVRRLDLDDGTKRIWQERPTPAGWQPGMDGTRMPLYRLPETLAHVAAGDRIVIVEGEKTVDALDRLDIFATTCPGGAGKWRPEHTATLAHAAVTVVADCDLPGRLHALDVTEELFVAGATVTMPLELNELANDGWDLVDELAAVVDAAREVFGDDDLRGRLRSYLDRLLVRPLPATAIELQHLAERIRYLNDPADQILLACPRCNVERVHRVSHGLAYCPCGAHQPAPP